MIAFKKTATLCGIVVALALSEEVAGGYAFVV
jgi:hypothetical protein